MREKIVLKLKTVFEYPNEITTIRKNEATISIDPNTHFLEYDVKIDYDQNVQIEDKGEDKGTVNLTYKKYDSGIIHMNDIVGIWKTSTSKYKIVGEEIKEEYEHNIEIATTAQAWTFTTELKSMKEAYETLVELYKEFKTK